VKVTPTGSFWCGGSNPLPVCSTGGFDGDDRALYDPGVGRWIITALQVHGSNAVAADLLAVSKTNDPTGVWYLYQFPSCGAFDTWDGSDQPHTGFNGQWIVVDSACSANPTDPASVGAALAVFDKAQVYSGASLTLNQNWFEFVDPYNEANNPAATYAPITNNREYLSAAAFDGSQAAVVYSYVEGAADSPVYVAGAELVTTGFQASGLPAVDAPGSSACLQAWTNGWIHSSGVWSFRNGTPYVLSTMVLGDPRFSNSTQVVNLALNTNTGTAFALQLAGGRNGAGAMASEIAMPLVRSGGTNQAVIVYDFSASDFYPGVKSATWNLDRNTAGHLSTLNQGVVTPTGFAQGRWTDFIDALMPIPGSSSLLAGGTLAAPSTNSTQGASYWTTVAP
jgi:hypothetical protein